MISNKKNISYIIFYSYIQSKMLAQTVRQMLVRGVCVPKHHCRSITSKTNNIHFLPRHHRPLTYRHMCRSVSVSQTRALSVSRCVWREVILPDNTIQSPVQDIDIPTDLTVHDHFLAVCDKYGDTPAMVGSTAELTMKTLTFQQQQKNG